MTTEPSFVTATSRALRDPQVLGARLAAVRTCAGVRPLNEWVDRLREQLGGGQVVPWFDPASGGVGSRSLFLLEAPGRMAMGNEAGLRRTGSGIISVDNDDQTAHNCWTLRKEAGLPYRESVHWNIVPWYLGSAARTTAAGRVTPAGRSEIQEAAPYLHEVVSLLPELRVVVPMGRKAQEAWAAYLEHHRPNVRTLPTWHPSPRVFATRPTARREVLQTLSEVARLLGTA